MFYLDSSALVKLVAPEAESRTFFEFLDGTESHVSSALARVEMIRAVAARLGACSTAAERSESALSRVALVRISDAILSMAAELRPTTLRTLDAIHLATAKSLGDDLTGFVAYDKRLIEAAREHGLGVLSPGS